MVKRPSKEEVKKPAVEEIKPRVRKGAPTEIVRLGEPGSQCQTREAATALQENAKHRGERRKQQQRQGGGREQGIGKQAEVILFRNWWWPRNSLGRRYRKLRWTWCANWARKMAPQTATLCNRRSQMTSSRRCSMMTKGSQPSQRK